MSCLQISNDFGPFVISSSDVKFKVPRRSAALCCIYTVGHIDSLPMSTFACYGKLGLVLTGTWTGFELDQIWMKIVWIEISPGFLFLWTRDSNGSTPEEIILVVRYLPSKWLNPFSVICRSTKPVFFWNFFENSGLFKIHRYMLVIEDLGGGESMWETKLMSLHKNVFLFCRYWFQNQNSRIRWKKDKVTNMVSEFIFCLCQISVYECIYLVIFFKWHIWLFRQNSLSIESDNDLRWWLVR